MHQLLRNNIWALLAVALGGLLAATAWADWPVPTQQIGYDSTQNCFSMGNACFNITCEQYVSGDATNWTCGSTVWPYHQPDMQRSYGICYTPEPPQVGNGCHSWYDFACAHVVIYEFKDFQGKCNSNKCDIYIYPNSACDPNNP